MKDKCFQSLDTGLWLDAGRPQQAVLASERHWPAARLPRLQATWEFKCLTARARQA